MKKFTILLMCTVLSAASAAQTPVSEEIQRAAADELAVKFPARRAEIEKGVRQTARLWRQEDGSPEEFKAYVLDNFLSDPVEKERVFLKISDYLEAIFGHYNRMSERLQWNTIVDNGQLDEIDERFAAFSPSAHLTDDLYKSRIAFFITLNFPQLTLSEKEALGDDRLAWAYARLGDLFTERIPASVQQQAAAAGADADLYVAGYNIYMGIVRNSRGEKIFPQDQVLLSHWNLRDEIKANYGQGPKGLDKQRTVYEVMKRIVSQEIPRSVIDSGEREWNPFVNAVYESGVEVSFTPESTVRYQKLLNNFHVARQIDRWTGNTAIDRNFNDDMEIALEEAESIFREFLASPELKQVGALIAERLGRPLEAFDIWYDGFKPRSGLDQEKLSELTRRLYPDAAAFGRGIPEILQKLGFSPERSVYLGEKIGVDPARGSGHAWGAVMKGQQSRLRTRVPKTGMDYKGYNIAIHELGHNVEQTISLYDVDYYLLNGVPNTGFTEALAFVFQKRDLELLGMKNDDPQAAALNVLDKVWRLYEITGVSMLDVAVWKWLYAHPEATAAELREAVLDLSRSIWNEYYAPVFGIRDETVQAVYSHMIGSPLYLSAYAFGQIIEFQLENYLRGKDFAGEVGRIYTLGRLTPNRWMQQATGMPLSTESLLEALRGVLAQKGTV